MACSNNFKQIGLALHNYHDVHNSIPPGRDRIIEATGGTVPSQGYWWSPDVFLFPFMELIPAWDGIMSLDKRCTQAHYFGEPVQFLVGPFPAYRCPSDSEVQQPSNFAPAWNGVTYRSSRTSTRYCMGDGMWNHFDDWDYTGYSAVNNPRVYTRGMFAARHHKDLAFASDGTSNTVAVSEKCCGDTQGSGTNLTVTTRWVRSGCTQGNNPQIYNNGAIIPANCLQNAPSASDRTILANPGPIWAGQLFGDGRPINGGFNTVLPPNSPSCGYSTTKGGEGWGVISATSYHKGGINAVFLDGSVHFIPDTINCGDLNGPQGGTHEGTGTQPVSSGASSYGVWGAMGTPNGGESTSL